MTKTIKRIIAGISTLAILAGAAVGGWLLGKSLNSENQFTVDTETSGGGTILDTAEESVISLASTEISPSEYAEYGVSPLAETAYTLTVTPTPSDVTDTYTWTSTNNTQIQLAPSGDTKSCTVTCSGAFGTQATITVTSNTNSDAYATCVVDYVKRVSSLNVSVTGGKITFTTSGTNTSTVTVTPVYGTGTITPDFEVDYISLYCDFIDDVTTTMSNAAGSLNAYTSYFEYDGNSASIGDPFSTFVTSTYTGSAKSTYSVSSSSIGRFSAVPMAIQVPPTESQLKQVFNNSFCNLVSGTTSDGHLVIRYISRYNGTVYSNTSYEYKVAFNVSSVTLGAAEVNLSDSSLVF